MVSIRRSRLAAIILGLVAGLPQTVRAADIVDYFKLYYEQEVIHPSGASMPDFLRNAVAGHLTADQLLKPGAARSVTIDRRDGYLQIDDSSDTDQVLTMALYSKADGSGLIVVGTSDCADACDFTVQFFAPTGHAWKDVPRDRVVPAISASQFIKAGHSIPKALAGNDPKINYLPARVGTTLTLKPWYGYEAEEQMDAATRGVIQDVVLQWDRRNGVFAAAPER